MLITIFCITICFFLFFSFCLYSQQASLSFIIITNTINVFIMFVCTIINLLCAWQEFITFFCQDLSYTAQVSHLRGKKWEKRKFYLKMITVYGKNILDLLKNETFGIYIPFLSYHVLCIRAISINFLFVCRKINISKSHLSFKIKILN